MAHRNIFQRCPALQRKFSRKISSGIFYKSHCLSKIISGFFPKFSERKNFKLLSRRFRHNPLRIPQPSLRKIPKTHYSGTSFFRVQTISNPGSIRAPIPLFSGTEPYTAPDLDPPTPCLVRNSWKFLQDRRSGCVAIDVKSRSTT